MEQTPGPAITTELPAQPPPSEGTQPQPYETCDHCNAPVESSQRYCVVCGTRRKHVHDPAARFLSSATSRNRTGARAARQATGARQRGPALWTAVVLALIPLAVVLGLLLGRSGNGENAKLLAALRAQKPEVVNVGGGAGATGASSSATPASLSSDFSLQRGYAIELGTLASSSTQSAATAAEKADRAKGASAVGLISQSDFTLTPKPPPGDYVIYSGQYKTQSEAQSALAKLKKAFRGAFVISVVATGSSGQSGAALNTTAYGTFHSIVGIKPPSKAQLNQGAAATKQVASQINQNYVQSQKGLPNQISVP
jgi:SPOR domain